MVWRKSSPLGSLRVTIYALSQEPPASSVEAFHERSTWPQLATVADNPVGEVVGMRSEAVRFCPKIKDIAIQNVTTEIRNMVRIISRGILLSKAAQKLQGPLGPGPRARKAELKTIPISAALIIGWRRKSIN